MSFVSVDWRREDARLPQASMLRRAYRDWRVDPPEICIVAGRFIQQSLGLKVGHRSGWRGREGGEDERRELES